MSAMVKGSTVWHRTTGRSGTVTAKPPARHGLVSVRWDGDRGTSHAVKSILTTVAPKGAAAPAPGKPDRSPLAVKVSAACKELTRCYRREKIAAFARRMRQAADRVRYEGARCSRIDGGNTPRIPRRVLNALCWGVGDEHNRAMIAKYTEAAVTAERFLRR